MTQFKKGNKFGGKAKGTPNKVTAHIREAFTNLLTNNLDKIEEDLKAIKEPEKRVKLFLELAQFCSPKLRSIDAEVSIEPKIITEFDIKKLYDVNKATD